MFDVSHLIGRYIDRVDGPAKIVGGVITNTFSEISGKTTGQVLELLIERSNGWLQLERAQGAKIIK